MHNPSHFSKGDIIRSIYSGKIYQVVEPNKSGIAKLECDGYVTDWNAHNNAHFEKVEIGSQLNLFL